MCGIFGYVSQSPKSTKTALDGLKILEYRGYDSWGIAVKQKTKDTKQKIQFIVEKQVGKIGNSVLSSKFLVPSSLAIGHTRWATHGAVTEANTHPHLDCTEKIAVVHNGIVENFEILKSELLKKNHKFQSDTDSEIISHLIEEHMKKFAKLDGKQGFATAVRNAFNQLHGMNAIVVSHAKGKEIVAAKTGSPLVIGKDKNTYYVASDASSILPHTNKVLFLKDNQFAIIGRDLQLLSLTTGKKQKINFEKINWKIGTTKLGKFPHFMLKEIYDQPINIRMLANTYEKQIKDLSTIIKNAKGTFFIGAGTAAYAGLVGTYFFSKIAHRHVNMAHASEFNYLLDFLNSKSLVIALSQSGETIDVVEPLSKARTKGSTIVAITNTQGSTIYRMSDKQLLLGAGLEQAVASTKAYLAKISILFLLSFAIKNDLKNGMKQLLTTANEIDRIIKQKNKLLPIVNVLSKSEHIYIIGRGVSYPTALEAALKIREVSYIHAEGLAGGELKHGTIALISKGTPCIAFAPNDETYQAIIGNAIEIKSRGGLIIGVGDKKEKVYDYWIEVKDCLDSTAIAQIVPIQLLAYLLAIKKGLDPDKPRNLAKSVTVK